MADSLNGQPRIVDGDTVVLDGHSIRFDGIDAPETDQVCLDSVGKRSACGLAARSRLTEEFGNYGWSCEITGKDTPRRRLTGRCAVNGTDINEWLVRQGLALDYPTYSRGRYAGAEAEAKRACRGMWAGTFYRPWEWRNARAETPVGCRSATAAELEQLSPEKAPDSACQIKANYRRADCIYHLPGTGHWKRLRMEGADRRWFCNAEEAEAAGCRASR